MKKLFTSESVTEGHPDKICDQISDAILDDILSKDPYARVACETCVKDDTVIIMGEISTTCKYNVDKIARKVIKDIGYDDNNLGFCSDSANIIIMIEQQSPDIAVGVDNALETRNSNENSLGAGDQGIMFGYANNETEELMPYPIHLAHKLSKRLAYVRKNGILDYLRPDGKTQVTVEYDTETNEVKRVDTIVVSAQHDDDINIDKLMVDIKKEVIIPSMPKHLIDENTTFLINPTGRFVIGGPVGDSGLTGRKIIVDTYGGMARHGGGAFSGKDCTKVDRSASYYARYVAKNIVKAGLADICEIQVSYAIGVAHPTSIEVETHNTSKTKYNLEDIIMKHFDFRPSAIIEKLQLRRPIYLQTASYGHFGRLNRDLPWEETDMVEELKQYL